MVSRRSAGRYSRGWSFGGVASRSEVCATRRGRGARLRFGARPRDVASPPSSSGGLDGGSLGDSRRGRVTSAPGYAREVGRKGRYVPCPERTSRACSDRGESPRDGFVKSASPRRMQTRCFFARRSMRSRLFSQSGALPLSRCESPGTGCVRCKDAGKGWKYLDRFTPGSSASRFCAIVARGCDETTSEITTACFARCSVERCLGGGCGPSPPLEAASPRSRWTS